MKQLPTRFSLVAVVLLMCTAICGCGNRTGLVPVSGKVVFDGRDLPKVCRLTFLPIGDSPSGQTRPGSATMLPDGGYELTKYQGIRGLYPGEYKVTAAYYDLKPGGDENVEADWKEVVVELPENLVIAVDDRRTEYDVVIP